MKSKEEFNLSEIFNRLIRKLKKEITYDKEKNSEYYGGYIKGIELSSTYIKEFIKRLKEEIENPTYPYANVFQLIDKLAGEELI